LFTQATTLAPDDAYAWLQSAGFQIRSRHYDQARAIAAQGLKHLPNNADLVTIEAQAKVLDGGKSADLQPLIEFLSRDPHNAAGIATLELLTEAKSADLADSQLLTRLRQLADQYPEFLPLQAILTQAYSRNGRFDEAITIATRSEQLFPADAQAAQMSTQVYAAANRYGQMLLAAQRWRRLSNEHPLNADSAIARAQISLGDLTAAAQTLAPYLAQARLEPDRYPDAFTANLYLLVASGKSADAAQLLTPLCSDSSQWRTTWYALASAHPTAQAAVSWMNALPAAAVAAPADAFSASNAWFNIAQQFNHKEAYQRAESILTKLTAQPDASMNQWQLLAYVERAQGKLKEAEAAFRKVLLLEPNHPDTQNNVAYLILLRNGDLGEARQLAEGAVAANPGSVSYLDTLARIQDKQGNVDAALTTFNKGLSLEPTNVEILVGKASMLLRAGRKGDVIAMAPQLDQAARGAAGASADVMKQLQAVRTAITQK
jgi:tetratricopeptide (TPR) repeat protein